MANIVTVKEVSEYLRLSDSTIYKLASNGEIPGFKIGHSWGFDMDGIIKRIKEIERTMMNGKEVKSK